MTKKTPLFVSMKPRNLYILLLCPIWELLQEVWLFLCIGFLGADFKEQLMEKTLAANAEMYNNLFILSRLLGLNLIISFSYGAQDRLFVKSNMWNLVVFN